MSRNLKFSDRKKLQRIFVHGRNRGLAAAHKRMREERDQEDSEREAEQPRDDDDE